MNQELREAHQSLRKELGEAKHGVKLEESLVESSQLS